MNIAKIILNQINNIFYKKYNVNGSYCYNKNLLIYCNSDYYDIIYNMHLKILLNNETDIELPLDLMIKNKTNENFYLSIEINEFNIDKNQNIIKIGKDLFNSYYIIFDETNKRIGIQKNEKIQLFIDEKYHYSNIISKFNINNKNNNLFLLRILLFVVIIISFLGAILLIYIKKIS
jgi:hypothetical protein